METPRRHEEATWKISRKGNYYESFMIVMEKSSGSIRQFRLIGIDVNAIGIVFVETYRITSKK